MRDDEYVIDLKCFDKIHCRRPNYQCINHIEYYILNDDNEIIDSIKITSEPVIDDLYIVDKNTYDKINFYMEENRVMPKITEEYTLHNPADNILTIECEHIYLHQTSMDLKIEFPTEKIEQFDYLIINGIKFKKEKGE